ncbi:hypothetical protein Tco_1517602 [Tanacetum coccineum]
MFKMTMASKSYEKHLDHKALYDALIQSLFVDEDDMDKAAAAANLSTQLKRQHDDQDEYPSAGPNQGKKTKMRRIKESESSNKSSTSKETSKGNTPPKASVGVFHRRIDVKDHSFSSNSKVELFMFDSNYCIGSVKKRFESSRDNFAYKEYGMRLMLAPRSAKALHEKALLKLHGIRNLPGSPSFGRTLF